MGLPTNQVPLTVEFHDELDINHVMGCKKCGGKKKKRQQGEIDLVTIPWSEALYNPSRMI